MSRPFTMTTNIVMGNVTVHVGIYAEFLSNITVSDYYKEELREHPENLPSTIARHTNNTWFERPTCHLWNYSLDGQQGTVRRF